MIVVDGPPPEQATKLHWVWQAFPVLKRLRHIWRRAAAIFWVQFFFGGVNQPPTRIIWKMVGHGGPRIFPLVQVVKCSWVDVLGDSSWFRSFRADTPEKPGSLLKWVENASKIWLMKVQVFGKFPSEPGGFCSKKFFCHSKILDVTSSQHL